jgi:hypothetical protein
VRQLKTDGDKNIAKAVLENNEEEVSRIIHNKPQMATGGGSQSIEPTRGLAPQLGGGPISHQEEIKSTSNYRMNSN